MAYKFVTMLSNLSRVGDMRHTMHFYYHETAQILIFHVIERAVNNTKE